MQKTLTEILKKTQKRKRDYFENYNFFCQEIRRKAEELLGKIRVIIFGSLVKKKSGPRSDIDILIISENLPEDWEERRKIRREIKFQIGLFSPFQIHLATPIEFERWYKKFIKKEYIEI